jgi:hypothetical protein
MLLISWFRERDDGWIRAGSCIASTIGFLFFTIAVWRVDCRELRLVGLLVAPAGWAMFLWYSAVGDRTELQAVSSVAIVLVAIPLLVIALTE